MHLLPLPQGSLDPAPAAVDVAQTPADVVVLSFSDGDLAALAGAAAGADGLPSLRLAGLKGLQHPFSVDLYVEKVAARSRFVLVRILGGLDYWRYGLEELGAAARRHGFQLAAVPGCDRLDPRLDALSTLPEADLRRLWRYFREGGPDNLREALRFVAARLGGDVACRGSPRNSRRRPSRPRCPARSPAWRRLTPSCASTARRCWPATRRPWGRWPTRSPPAGCASPRSR